MMMRFCPKCHTERAIREIVCEGQVNGVPCWFNLSEEAIHESGWRPPVPVVTADQVDQPQSLHIPERQQGQQENAQENAVDNPSVLDARIHTETAPVFASSVVSDLSLASPDTTASSHDAYPQVINAQDHVPPSQAVDAGLPQETCIDGWHLISLLSATEGSHTRYWAKHDDGRDGVLTLWKPGAEPDADVYEVLRQLPRRHVPKLFATGRFQDQPYQVMEALTGETLADLGTMLSDIRMVKSIVREVGEALDALSEAGLRHRGLRPSALLIRSKSPLDLVISSFGSASLSDYDLEIVSTLDITRYSAPETIAGAVCTASDWWSLGMILLEQLTHGACFDKMDEASFFIHIMTNGVEIPENLDASLRRLLAGLLARKHQERWQWPQVQAWLQGEEVPLPSKVDGQNAFSAEASIELAGRHYHQPALWALAAAEKGNWRQARLMLEETIPEWLAGIEGMEKQCSLLKQICTHPHLNSDFRQMLALLLLNSQMPLVLAGEIISPAWLLKYPVLGYELISGPVVDMLEQIKAGHWLGRLHERARRVRQQAHHLHVQMQEDALRVYLLYTTHAQLVAAAQERRLLYPDAHNHAGVLSLLEHQNPSNDDLIILLSASVDQFATVQEVVDAAAELARTVQLEPFDKAKAHLYLQQPRQKLYHELNGRTEGLAVTGQPEMDQWMEQYRLERRLPLTQLLVLLSVPQAHWVLPGKRAYLTRILEFFEKKVTVSALMGPLVRMRIGRYTPRVDLSDLGTARITSRMVADHILSRKQNLLAIDPAAIPDDSFVKSRISNLSRQSDLYKRDTGIDGLYMGFPFLLFQDRLSYRLPRIAPLLLWPIKLVQDVGERSKYRVSFDHEREEVRINPALENILGKAEFQRWVQTMEALLTEPLLQHADVMDRLSTLAQVLPYEGIQPIPVSFDIQPGQAKLACAAVFFHVNFIGQAIGEELRQLKHMPLHGTGLATLLRLNEAQAQEHIGPTTRRPEEQRFLTVQSDPSQEDAIDAARAGEGLSIEGPPGTGKSQTIVNMVADAIGCGKTLLIVCQKKAALEVVHKRLVAEGLGTRCVMIHDTFADRDMVIRGVREQIEGLRKPAKKFPYRTRQQVAAEIESLEGQLDRYNEALQMTDPQTGLSYRQLMVELIALQKDEKPVELPVARVCLSELSPQQLVNLIAEMQPVLKHWLPAYYENSPLAGLQTFPNDPVVIGQFTERFAALKDADGVFCDALARNRDPVAKLVEPAQAYSQWIKLYRQDLLKLDEDDLLYLKRWQPLFVSLSGSGHAGEGNALVEQLHQLQIQYSQGNAQDWHERLSLNIVKMSDDLLDTIELQASVLAEPTPWYAFFSYKFLQCRSSVRKVLAGFGEEQKDAAAVRALRDALRLEEKWRPVRQAMQKICLALNEPVPANESGPALGSYIAQLYGVLHKVQQWCLRISQSPNPEEIRRVISETQPAKNLRELMLSYDTAIYFDGLQTKRIQALEALKPYFSGQLFQHCLDAIARHEKLPQEISQIGIACVHLGAYQNFRLEVPYLSTRAMELFAALSPMREKLKALPVSNLNRAFELALHCEARLAWKERIEQDYPELLLGREERLHQIKQLSEADQRMRQLNRLMLQEAPVKQLAQPQAWEEITRLRGARAKRLREFIETGEPLGLMKLCPVWLMNPDVASRVLPLKAGLFDAVVYDEASQMPVEYALPTLFRGKRVIISGDEKQMPPSSFFSAQVEADDEDMTFSDSPYVRMEQDGQGVSQDEWNRREILDCPDLLQLARAVLPQTTLQIHYRSDYRELIAYSNAAFYGNRLSVPVSHPPEKVLDVKPVELIQVNGLYHEQQNRDEAQRVVEILVAIWQAAGEIRPSVGIATFNKKQASLIEDLLEKRAQEDDAFRHVYACENQRKENGEDMSIFVKNVENVQGDERDIIIFSTTFGKNKDGFFYRNFGVLGQYGGERRLNVAVTRARRKVIMVTSMPIADISDMLTTQRAPATPRDYLQAYLEYARLLTAGELKSAQGLLNRLTMMPGEGIDIQKNEHVVDDPFIREVDAYLQSLNVHYQRGAGRDAFAMDFAIKDSEKGRFILGIECDAPVHPLLKYARAREIWRPGVLKRVIPNMHRISSQLWYLNGQAERLRLKSAIDQALQAADLPIPQAGAKQDG